MKTKTTYIKTLVAAVVMLAALMVPQKVWADNTITLGEDGTEKLAAPISYNWMYSYTQQLYTQAEMGSRVQLIKKISFYFVGTENGNGKSNVKIYMGNTSKTRFSSTSDYVPSTDITEVYSGSFNCTVGWNEITLTTPFVYNGKGSLVVALDDNTGSFLGAGGNNCYFRHSTTSDKMTLTYYSDSDGDISPSNPTSAGSTQIKATRVATKFVTEDIAIVDNGGTLATGDNAHRTPVNNYYNYSYTQQIYTSAELGSRKSRITKIYFYYDYNYTTTQKTNVTMYMGHTDKSSFSSENDYVAHSGLKQVYSGSLNCKQGWNEFVLSTPFEYNGTSNLVVALDDNSGTYSGSNYKFRHQTTSSNMSLCYYSDNSDSNPDPSSLSSYSGNKVAFSSRVLTAFTKTPYYTITTTTNNSTWGTVTPATNTYIQGTSVTLTATANQGYHFQKWSDGITSTTRTVTVTGNASYTAQFAACSYNSTSGVCTTCYKGQKPSQSSGVYQISKPGHMLWFAEYAKDYSSSSFALTADINMSGYSYISPFYATSLDNLSYNTNTKPQPGFGGTFDGKGHVISNLKVPAEKGRYSAGIVGNNNGTIKNVILKNFYYENNGDFDGRFGAICGVNFGTVSTCGVANSTVRSKGHINGAVAGANYGGTIKNCFAYQCNVNGHTRHGYLVGDNRNDLTSNPLKGTIIYCYVDSARLQGTQIGTSCTGEYNISEARFKSGEITYKLNQNGSPTMTWYQTIGTDIVPMLSNTSKTVYYLFKDCAATAKSYTNTNNGHTAEGHNMSALNNAIAATCTSKGRQAYYTCSFCGSGKYYKDNGTHTTSVWSSIVIEALNHDMTKHEGWLATCVDDGQETYYTCSRSCCKDKKYKDNGLQTTDVWDNVVIKANGSHECNNKGICSVCSEELSDVPNYLLIDNEEYVRKADFTAQKVTFDRKYSHGHWNTWFMPFSVETSKVTDAGFTPMYIESIHTFDDNGDGTTDRTLINVMRLSNSTMKAGTPYLVYSNQDKDGIELANVSFCKDTEIHDISLRTGLYSYNIRGSYAGISAETIAAGTHYSANENGVMVAWTKALPPYRWAISQTANDPLWDTDGAAGSKRVEICIIGEMDDATGIRTIYPEQERKTYSADGIFNLSGQKLSQTRRGLNIVNGKKIMVK